MTYRGQGSEKQGYCYCCDRCEGRKALKTFIVTLKDGNGKIGLSNLVDRAIELYERKLITFEMLEYLLGLSELTNKRQEVIISLSMK